MAMGRPIASDQLDPVTRRRVLTHARRAARAHQRILDTEERHQKRLAELQAQRDAEWRAATELGMSRTEAARIAGLHHSAVDRALA